MMYGRGGEVDDDDAAGGRVKEVVLRNDIAMLNTRFVQAGNSNQLSATGLG